MRSTSKLLARAVQATGVRQKLLSLRGENPRLYNRSLIHVTSEKLCDDALQILKSSLPPPHSCDILDLNPGPCVWSQKLHELVQPRRHILVEPRRSLFADFIEPLLTDSGSCYRYAHNLRDALDPERQYLSADVYNFRGEVEQHKAPQYKLNEKLLVIANLSGAARKVPGFKGSEAKLFLNDYYHSMFRQDYLHKFGLVRLLAWVAEDSRVSVMPLTVASRAKQSVQLEATCHIDQIAGPTQSRNLQNFQKRWYELEAENQRTVRAKQEKDGIQISPPRNQPSPEPPFAARTPIVDEVRKYQNLYDNHQVYIQRLLALDKDLSINEPERYADYQQEELGGFQKPAGLNVPKRSIPPKMTEYRILMTQLRTHHNTFLKMKYLILEQRQLFRKIVRAFAKGWFSTLTALPLPGMNEDKAKSLLDKDQKLQAERQSITFDTRKTVNKAGDDYRCYDSPTPILSWNQRSFEPILVRDSEFVPSNPLTLFDIRPKLSLATKLNTLEKLICFDYVCTVLMKYRSESVLRCIQRLIPADYERFLDGIPELRDPTKGGWWDLDQVRIRALHTDVFVAIALAFHGWSHRPPISKLMAVHKGVFDVDGLV